MITTLATPRLILRPIDLLDFGMLQRLLGDPDDCLLLGCDPFNQEGGEQPHRAPEHQQQNRRKLSLGHYTAGLNRI